MVTDKKIDNYTKPRFEVWDCGWSGEKGGSTWVTDITAGAKG